MTRLDALTRKPLRWALGGFQSLRKAVWFFTRPRTFGVHAVPVTSQGKVVLVKLRYARGWRLPGGGRKAGEDAREAVLRELREEIGMIRHGEVRLVSDLRDNPDFKRETMSLFLVRDVEYSPEWSLEVESVMEAPPDRLPAGLSARARRWLKLVLPLL